MAGRVVVVGGVRMQGYVEDSSNRVDDCGTLYESDIGGNYQSI